MAALIYSKLPQCGTLVFEVRSLARLSTATRQHGQQRQGADVGDLVRRVHGTRCIRPTSEAMSTFTMSASRVVADDEGRGVEGPLWVRSPPWTAGHRLDGRLRQCGGSQVREQMVARLPVRIGRVEHRLSWKPPYAQGFSRMVPADLPPSKAVCAATTSARGYVFQTAGLMMPPATAENTSAARF